MRALLVVVVMVGCLGCPGPSTGTGGGAGGSSGGGSGGGAAQGGGTGGGVTGGGSGGGSLGGGTGGGTTGGGTGGGTTGGGTGGSTGGGTGGGTTGAGTVTFERLGYEPAIAAGPDSVLHLVFTTSVPSSAFGYARCAANCGIGTNWTVTDIDTSTPAKSHPRLVVGSDGRLHALYETDELSTRQTVYSSCASNCNVATNWSKVYLTSLFLGSSAAYRGAPMVIDAQNRVSFVVSTLSFNATNTLATCAGSCDTLTNWTTGPFRTGGNRIAMAARGTALHAVLFNEADSLVYRTCPANCTVAASWQESPALFIHDGSMPTAIVVTAQGGVRVAYNQGTSATNQTAAIKAQDNRLLVWTCDANCLTVAGWNGIILGDVDEGAHGLSLGEQAGALVLATTNAVEATGRLCTSNCLVAANWPRVPIDSSDAFRQGYDPLVWGGVGCSSQPPYFAGWYLDEGKLAIRPDGSVGIAFGSHLLRQCSAIQTTPTYLPGLGRVTFIP